MPSSDDALKALVRDEVLRQLRVSLTAQLMTVSAVHTADGTVDLNAGGTILLGVACQRSYTPRVIGDVVMVLWSPAGPRVLDVVGPNL